MRFQNYKNQILLLASSTVLVISFQNCGQPLGTLTASSLDGSQNASRLTPQSEKSTGNATSMTKLSVDSNGNVTQTELPQFRTSPVTISNSSANVNLSRKLSSGNAAASSAPAPVSYGIALEAEVYRDSQVGYKNPRTVYTSFFPVGNPAAGPNNPFGPIVQQDSVLKPFVSEYLPNGDAKFPTTNWTNYNKILVPNGSAVVLTFDDLPYLPYSDTYQPLSGKFKVEDSAGWGGFAFGCILKIGTYQFDDVTCREIFENMRVGRQIIALPTFCIENSICRVEGHFSAQLLGESPTYFSFTYDFELGPSVQAPANIANSCPKNGLNWVSQNPSCDGLTIKRNAEMYFVNDSVSWCWYTKADSTISAVGQSNQLNYFNSDKNSMVNDRIVQWGGNAGVIDNPSGNTFTSALFTKPIAMSDVFKAYPNSVEGLKVEYQIKALKNGKIIDCGLLSMDVVNADKVRAN